MTEEDDSLYSVDPSEIFSPPPFLPYNEKSCILNRADRPPIPYSVLIANALRTRPDQTMTLTDIYAWFEQFHPFYCDNNHNWRNSVRHTLSSSRQFKRIPKYNNASGRGSLWCLVNEEEVTNRHCNNKHKRRKSLNDMPTLINRTITIIDEQDNEDRLPVRYSFPLEENSWQSNKEYLDGMHANPELTWSQPISKSQHSKNNSLSSIESITNSLPMINDYNDGDVSLKRFEMGKRERGLFDVHFEGGDECSEIIDFENLFTSIDQ